MGTLYIVGTPIGNLGDFSPRAIEILKTVDFIAAEDTRVTLKLLNHFEIRNTLISYHEHNAAARGPELLERLLNGENGAIVTDAGMPCISDPGEGLVALCHENEVEIATVPGPTAAMTALAASGLPTGKFLFEGFLPIKKGERDAALQAVSRLPHTLIFYEAPHRLRQTLAALLGGLGDRPITLCRELTKLHEDIWKTTLGEAVEHYKVNEPRGEYVLVMAGAPETTDPEQELTLEQAAQRALELTGQGFGPTAAAKAAAQGTPYSKSEVYKQLLVLQQGQQAEE